MTVLMPARNDHKYTQFSAHTPLLLSEVIGAMSSALDMTEGQPVGADDEAILLILIAGSHTSENCQSLKTKNHPNEDLIDLRQSVEQN